MCIRNESRFLIYSRVENELVPRRVFQDAGQAVGGHRGAVAEHFDADHEVAEDRQSPERVRHLPVRAETL